MAKTKALIAVRGGKPTVYSEIVATVVFEKLASGYTLPTICNEDGMPSAATVMEWYLHPNEDKRPGFVEKFEKSRRIGLELMAHNILDIADDSGKDTVTKVFKGKRIKVTDQEAINRDRLRVQARQWMLEKLLPQFSNVTKVEHSGQIDLTARLQEGRRRAMELSQSLKPKGPEITAKVEVLDDEEV